MKTFYASLIVFGVLLALILTNAFFIRHATKEMDDLLNALPTSEDMGSTLESLIAYWEKHKKWISISTSSEVINNVDDHMIELQSAFDQNDAEGFDLAIRLTRNTIARIRREERFSIENLL